MSIFSGKKAEGAMSWHRDAKQQQAIDRQALRKQRTAEEQIELLNTRPGNSTRERAELTSE